jgi:serine protease Do
MTSKRVRLGMSAFVAGLLVMGFAPMEAARAGSTPTMAWSDIAARALPATVNIVISKVGGGDADTNADAPATPGQSNQFVGSGFIIDPTGIIVTNKHVIDGAQSITVTLQDGTETRARVLAQAAFIDIALLKVEVGHALPTLKLGDGDATRPGDPVLAIGNPLGVGTSLSAGIVSGNQRDLMNSPFDDYVQTDAAINHGNSGGPLLDGAGNVIGVNTTLLTNQANEGSNGIGFAISSNVVAAVLDHLLQPVPKPIGWIGVHLQGMMPELAQALKIPKAGIAIITQIDPQSPASEAGLQAGDVILSFDGERLPNARLLMRKIAVTPVGATRTLQLWSAGKVQTFELPVRDWPGADAQAGTPPDNPACMPSPDPDLGLLLEPITALDRQIYELNGATGLLVAAVNPTSEAYSRGFRPGIVVVRINGEEVTTREAASRILDDAAKNTSVVALLVQWANGRSWFALHTGAGRGQRESRGGDEKQALCTAAGTQ